MPLRYHSDKPEKPRRSRAFGYLARLFIRFQAEESGPEAILWQKMLQERQNTLWAGCQLVPKRTFPLQRRNVLFAMQKHSKKQDAPFSRPFGATENDAQKLHALWLLPMIVVRNPAHEVLY